MKSRNANAANSKAAISYKKTNIAPSPNWNVENVAMNNIMHTYPANAATITQTQTQTQAGASCMYNCPQYSSQRMYAPDNMAYYVDPGSSTQHHFMNQYLHQSYNYAMYNSQPQYESQMQYPQAENIHSSYTDSKRNMYEYHYNLDNNVQEQPMAMLDVNNCTDANASNVQNPDPANTTLEEVIRSSLSDLTDLIDL